MKQKTDKERQKETKGDKRRQKKETKRDKERQKETKGDKRKRQTGDRRRQRETNGDKKKKTRQRKTKGDKKEAKRETKGDKKRQKETKGDSCFSCVSFFSSGVSSPLLSSVRRVVLVGRTLLQEFYHKK